MDNTIAVEFTVRAERPTFCLTVYFDDTEIYKANPGLGPTAVKLAIPEVDGKHSLTFELSGKEPYADTICDVNGNIVDDHMLIIEDLVIDDVPVGQLLFDHSIYCHDFNGNGEPTQAIFGGIMGCNGRAVFSFENPFYIWYLETVANGS